MRPMIYDLVLNMNAVREFAALSLDRQVLLSSAYFPDLAADPMGCGSQVLEEGPNDGYRKVQFGKIVVVYYVVDSAHVMVTLIAEL